jgi:hypothetical protein
MDVALGREDAITREQLVLPDDPTLTLPTDDFFDGLYTYLSREVL